MSTESSAKPLAVVLTGAGISAESGLRTFRDSGGLWEEHDIMAVASIEGWYRNPELVMQFYNDRRKQAFTAQPNAGHRALAALEAAYEVVVVTQNVDALHEKGGSTHVIHLHGELSKVRSSSHPELVYEVGDKAIALGEMCPEGSQLRPAIVWFGEDVPLYEVAAAWAAKADVFLVVGTSLGVYPAAGLLHEVNRGTPKFIIDPDLPPLHRLFGLEGIEATATVGLPKLVERLLAPEYIAGLMDRKKA